MFSRLLSCYYVRTPFSAVGTFDAVRQSGGGSPHPFPARRSPQDPGVLAAPTAALSFGAF